MKKKEFSDLRGKDIKDLKKLIAERKKKPADKNLRREIAQILTLIREKEIYENIHR